MIDAGSREHVWFAAGAAADAGQVRAHMRFYHDFASPRQASAACVVLTSWPRTHDNLNFNKPLTVSLLTFS